MLKKMLILAVPLLIAAAVVSAPPTQDLVPAVGNCTPSIDQVGTLMINDEPIETTESGNQVIRLDFVMGRYQNDALRVEVVNDSGANVEVEPFRTYRVKLVFVPNGSGGFDSPSANLVSVKKDGLDGDVKVPSFSSTPGLPGGDPGVVLINKASIPGALILVNYENWLTTIKLQDVGS